MKIGSTALWEAGSFIFHQCHLQSLLNVLIGQQGNPQHLRCLNPPTRSLPQQNPSIFISIYIIIRLLTQLASDISMCAVVRVLVIWIYMYIPQTNIFDPKSVVPCGSSNNLLTTFYGLKQRCMFHIQCWAGYLEKVMLYPLVIEIVIISLYT